MSQQQHQVAPHAATELAIKPSINTLAQGSMFWQPDYREASAWLEHLPFLFWLVEALRPQQAVGLGVDSVAHFAVCQAASRLRLGTRCFMIGEVAEAEVDAEAMRAYASEHFSAISQWVETNPTRAIEQFDERSIDLLLLHVNPDDNSVDYLLDRWLSRLSSQGVVVVPGVSRREPGSLVFRAFEAIKARYPHFVFHHAGGLGVIAIGNNLPPLVNNLLGALESNASTQVVQDVFARLGRSCQDKVTVRQQQALFQTLEARVSEQASSLTNAEEQVTQQAEQLRKAEEERGKLKARLEQQEARFAQERGRLAERVSSLEEFNAELKTELMRQRDQNERHQATAREEKTQLNAKLDKTEHSLTEIQTKYQSLQDRERVLSSEMKEASQKLESSEQRLREFQVENAELTSKLEKSEASLQARFNELGQLTRQLQEAEQRITETEQSRADSEKQLAQQHKANEEALSAQLEEAQNSVDERFQELAILTELLEKNEAQREQLERELGGAKAAKQKSEVDAQNAKQKLETDAQNAKKALEAEVKSSQEIQAQQRQEIERQTHELAHLIEQLEALRIGRAANSSKRKDTDAAVAKAPELTKRAIKRQVALIEASQWFDAKWYLAQYPDIASDPRMSGNPARHYLLMGGFEGRNPGPGFESAYYLAQYPDVVESGINPLVHYLKFGEKEQRSVKG